MREIYILLSLLCTTLLWGQQPLTQVQANAFKEKVVQKNKTIKTMQASFVQKKHLEFMSTSGKETLTKLLPKDKTLLKYIKEIHLFFSPDATVGRVKLIEPTDDYTEITFTHQQFNTPIDEATFKL